ncbi:NAD(P)/FAD-dependent oxidoreductase [Salisediminibacterium halotolerans]|uniref:NAD(P)/FAD-dependent oxidoreductase n=1 Tax=Salisediminibacterium halotolerans TaxID=517425 RepID=UPI000F1DE65E|nr:NAD(P)/FAD-dependent oxidoreductase [Salisediminibacterium halotolerans]RLJ73228.1 glycerol-3-phosphate dehydrogenase [Actinophytocola xinjiangensis]RPE86650.1 glycerol-3-phosphate dehydrogenase [Salisediminibacterium halotolerans]TWG34025.1 glycerol-3-phosphate dehydrogenase [Salisediminibacterium halotolerans]GEL08318.1 hypothetical protein SHA02_17340 [Salisediminibacterium halotolerans]
MYDYVIVGGGVVGSFIAHALSHYEGKTLLLEKERTLAQVQTTHNSALVHPELMMPPEKGELKARLGKEGNAMYQELAAQLDVPVNRNGALLVARSAEEMVQLKKMVNDARKQGTAEIDVLSSDEVREIEPNLKASIAGAVKLSAAMSADTSMLTGKIAERATKNGAQINTGEEVTAINFENGVFSISTSSGSEYQSRFLINAAGTANERIAEMVENEVPYKIEPQRGEYIVLDSSAKDFIQHIIYPLPTKKSKGVLMIPQPDGTIRLGPTSVEQSSIDSASVTEEGEKEIRAEIDRLVDNPPYDRISHGYAGIRSSINQEDFYIKPSHEAEAFIHVAGIDSPGVTAAPAIAKYVVEEVIAELEPLRRKKITC